MKWEIRVRVLVKKRKREGEREVGWMLELEFELMRGNNYV